MINEKQRAKSLIRAQIKRQALLDYIENLSINILAMSKDDLFIRAIRDYNRLHGKTSGKIDVITEEEFHMLAVNSLRHSCSVYEVTLDYISGKVGSKIAYALLKNKILDKIAEIYPFLEKECKKQKA